ncbi:MAG: hypothetical protein VX877_00165, partial [Planctomycetota bacterium]|nr:hypothetical protein [Planctomycetota bacterium]
PRAGTHSLLSAHAGNVIITGAHACSREPQSLLGPSSAASRILTKGESHRLVAIVVVMGRQSGYIALGISY